MENKENNTITYYQLHGKMSYPIFLKFTSNEIEGLLLSTISELNFKKLTESEWKAIQIIKDKTKILHINKATNKVNQQISMPMATIGGPAEESIVGMGLYDVYRYKATALMLMPQYNCYFEAGFRNFENITTVKTVITRFMSHALLPFGVVGFWGVSIDEGFVVMKASQAQSESVFIDLNNETLLTCDGVKELYHGINILRLDSTISGRSIGMKKEELLGFLCLNTTYLSYTGIDRAMRDAISSLVNIAQGYIYPTENFKPRTDLQIP